MFFILSTLKRWDYSAAVQELFSFGIRAKQSPLYSINLLFGGPLILNFLVETRIVKPVDS